MKMEMLNQYVLIKRDEHQEVSAGGVHLPQTNATKAINTGKVVSVNAANQFDLKVGDTIAFCQVQWEQEKDLLVLKEEMVMWVKRA